ncbi:MAG: hypothetical protein A3I73_00900 [Omnitrophica bacterium RIFCSPLOWO2_02_FULL_45_16]|nr:MAG: hypothetical protein A3C51_04330 [Omnitrophica bacterium RIFCSPHIGHO2_02_FULL_46_20]OGX00763.1 MAG: hypothetical protein A3I73_00900 [Omnitrophica bacterium RIFCSPLOWO2_02_FULL_45_16]
MKYSIEIVLVVIAILILIVASQCIPKYELYVSARDGTITYRFNRITGTLESLDDKNGWSYSSPIVGIKKP